MSRKKIIENNNLIEEEKEEVKESNKIKIFNSSQRSFILSNGILSKGQVKDIDKKEFEKIKNFNGLKVLK